MKKSEILTQPEPDSVRDTISRLQTFVSSVGKRYPGLWKQIDDFRVKHSRTWSKLCYLPEHYVRNLETVKTQFFCEEYTSEDRVYQKREIAHIAIAAGWRATQGVYRFDPDTLREVVRTRLDGDLPIDLFLHLPEWCCYVETPGFKGSDGSDGLRVLCVDRSFDWQIERDF